MSLDIIMCLAFTILFIEYLKYLCYYLYCTNCLKDLTTDEYSPEVMKARNQALERQRNAKNIRGVFLRKLNRILIGSLKLYADNLICMDLCGWSSREAIQLLGDQVSKISKLDKGF